MFLGKKKKREKLHVKISPKSALFKKAVENVGKRQSAGRQSLNGSENWPKPSSPFATAKHDLTLSPSPPSSNLESHLYPGEGDGKEGSKQASKQARRVEKAKYIRIASPPPDTFPFSRSRKG